MSARLIVLKFGSSVLRDETDLPRVAAEIRGYVTRGWRVLAVVSAIGDGTDALIRRGRALGASEGDGQAAFAALLGTGEAAAAALVGLALGAAGLECTVLDAGRVGPFTRGPQLDAMPHAFDSGTVRRALERFQAAVLPGFVGRDADGRHTLLGRGGSDLTALFVAHALDAQRCRLLKDVDGIYEHDPALRHRPRPRRYTSLGWEETLRLQDAILQSKAAQFAYRHRVRFEVGAYGDDVGTVVGAARGRLAS